MTPFASRRALGVALGMTGSKLKEQLAEARQKQRSLAAQAESLSAVSSPPPLPPPPAPHSTPTQTTPLCLARPAYEQFRQMANREWQHRVANRRDTLVSVNYLLVP